MDTEIFRKQVEEELKKMSGEQIVFFAWLCAVRALPFLCSEGNFNYWREKDLQRYLYAIFRALDTNVYYSAAYSRAYADTADRVNIWDAARAYADTVQAAYAAAKADADADTANTVGIAAAYADANAAYAFARATHDSYEEDCAYVAAFEAEANAKTRAAARAVASTVPPGAAAALTTIMQNILLTDIKEIKNKIKISNNDLKWYGEIWDNFQKVLKKESCKYWGDLYKDIFEKSFELNELDKEALKRRMNVPKEIQEQGATAVAAYLVELEKDATHLNEARIIILGEKGAGKTCLARRLVNPDADMTTEEESTAGVNTLLWNQDDINIHIWDFAGHTVTHAVHQFFLSERCLYILVYDGRTEERNRLEYWLNQMKNYGDKSEVYILINKRDPHPPKIPITTLKENYPVIDCYTLSIKDEKDKLENFRKVVTRYIKNNPSWSNQVIPANYFNVKKELEQHFADNKKEEYIDIAKFKEIAKKIMSMTRTNY